MLIAHRIALNPNNAQATYFARAAGIARFAYNWALKQWTEQYEAWKVDNLLPKPSQQALRRQLNSIKRMQYPLMLQVTKCAPQLAIMQLGDAFKNFFAGRAKYPNGRRKGRDDRFSLSNDVFIIKGSAIRIPHLGWVRMREPLRFAGKIMSATVSRVADRWFVSITVDTAQPPTLPNTENQGAAVGVDLGVSALATLSTGEPSVPGPKSHTSLLQRLRRLSRSLSRKQKKSANWRKARIKLAKLHARIACIRSDALHKLTTDLTRRFHVIGVEDLNVRGMMANSHLARAIGDMGFYEFRRQLQYKAAMRGSVIVVADRWFASSKLCSTCCYRLARLELSMRSWTCPGCHSTHDRDLNAAINLRNYAVSSTVSACGGEGAGLRGNVQVKPAPAKQEVSVVPARTGMSKSDRTATPPFGIACQPQRFSY